METPHVQFRYSSIYDRRFKQQAESQGVDMEAYPDREEIEACIDRVEPVWREQEAEVLTEMADVVNLSWTADHVTCYVVGRCIPFSDPLTIGVLHHRESDEFIDTLTHEMIHQLFIQSRSDEMWGGPIWTYIWERYDESKITKIHIPLYAIHEHLYRELFSVERMERDINQMKERSEDHYRAWQIVQDEGYETVLEQVRQQQT